MDIWHHRRQADEWLRNELADEGSVIEEGLELLDRATAEFNVAVSRAGSELAGEFLAATGLAVAKGRNLFLASYSLVLDSLAQEAGAVLRPLVEAIEVLEYLYQDPTRASAALGGDLPKAGAIAKAIEGQYRDVRDYANAHASHLSFGAQSMRALLDDEGRSFRAVRPATPDLLRRNLYHLAHFQRQLVTWAVSCLYGGEHEVPGLAHDAERWKERSERVFQDDG